MERQLMEDRQTGRQVDKEIDRQTTDVKDR